MLPDSILNYGGTLFVIVALPAMGIIAKFFGVSWWRIAKWYCYTAVFCVLSVVNSILFPFIGGKDYFLRYAVELGLIALILWWAFEAKAGEMKRAFVTAYKKPLVKAVTIFVAAFILACLFALDMHAAFWSNYERGEGGFQMLHYFAFFMLLVILFQSEEDWRNIFKFSLIASVFMIGYGVIANLGYSNFVSPYAGGTAPTGLWDKLVSGRFEGTLGNPAYVAPYLMFSMFFAAYLWLSEKISNKLTTWKAWLYGISIVISLIFFWLSQTRGAFIGLIAGIFVMIVYLAFAGTKKIRKWSIVLLGIMIVLGVIGFTIRNNPTVQNIPGARLLQISLSDSSAQTRLWVWGEAWKGFLERPVFGWGPENFTAVFDKYFDPRFFIPGQQTETWFDRAHSVYFDYLVETGIIGLLSYLAIFLVLAVEFFRRRKSRIAAAIEQHKTAHVLEDALMLGIPVAYLVQGIAIFDVLPMYINVFLFLAFANYYLNRHERNV
jgi:O-antigen ligase